MKAALALLLVACSEAPAEVAPAFVEPSDTEILRAQVKTNPADADAWYHLADLYDRSSDYTEQAAALEHVVALKPGSGYPHFKLGTVYDRLGRHAEAVEQFKVAQRTIPDQPVLHNNLGVAYGKLGKTPLQIASFRQALKLRPDYITAHYNLGMALLRSGNRREAEREYLALKDLDEGAAASLRKELDK